MAHDGASYGIGRYARYASAMGLSVTAAANSLSMLAPGKSSAAPTSYPDATIGVGHSANTFLAAGMSALMCASGAPAGKAPPATTRYLTLAAIVSFNPGNRSAPARTVAGPLSTKMAFPSYIRRAPLRE